MEKKCGIYAIKNTINNKVYIGQSVNIFLRWKAHLYSSASNTAADNNVKIHCAMRELGQNNFFLEIIEETTKEQLNEKEKYWIAVYDSFNNGYNGSLGGTNVQGENNPRSKLTKEDVITIRTLYRNKIPFREVFKLYDGIISKRGLQKVWHCETWVDILPEVYSQENLTWHATKAKGWCQKGMSGNQQRKIDDEIIRKVRVMYKEGKTYIEISKALGCTASTVRKYCLNLQAEKPVAGISVKNVETGKIFNSYTEAASWSQTNRKNISKVVDTQNSAGVIPDSNVPATWTTNIF